MRRSLCWITAMGILSSCKTNDADAIDKSEARLSALEKRIAALEVSLEAAHREVSACQAATERNASLKAPVDALEPLRDLASFVTVSGADIIIEGANLHVRNAQGETASVDGTGNLIIGYNEQRETRGSDEVADRSGSHNIVLGPGHGYSSYGGYVGGSNNSVSARHAAVVAGAVNEASGDWSAVVSGSGNVASGLYAVVLAGSDNRAIGWKSLIGTGFDNIVDGMSSAIVGGRDQVNNRDVEVVVGGWELPE